MSRNSIIRRVKSRPAWARELKLAALAGAYQAVSSRPAWARELKLVDDLDVAPVQASRPAWARELKRIVLAKLEDGEAVAPRVGA